jgi:hypothetical protein
MSEVFEGGQRQWQRPGVGRAAQGGGGGTATLPGGGLMGAVATTPGVDVRVVGAVPTRFSGGGLKGAVASQAVGGGAMGW